MGYPKDQRTPTESMRYPMRPHAAPHLRHGVSHEVHGVRHDVTHGMNRPVRYPMGTRGVGHGSTYPRGVAHAWVNPPHGLRYGIHLGIGHEPLGVTHRATRPRPITRIPRNPMGYAMGQFCHIGHAMGVVRPIPPYMPWTDSPSIPWGICCGELCFIVCTPWAAP